MPDQSMTSDPFVPGGVDSTRPSMARVYDFLLGGKHNFESDRIVGQQLTRGIPDLPRIFKANRALMRRAVRYMHAQGIRQFLDLGSGIPTVENIHQILPDDTVIYVDIDPVAIAHGQALLADYPRATAVQADVRDTQTLMDHPQIQATLDFSQPIGVTLLYLLHFVVEQAEAKQIVRTLQETLPAGSYIAISQSTNEEVDNALLGQLLEMYSRAVVPFKMRSKAEFEDLFEGLELVAPGIVYMPLWRPAGTNEILLEEPARSMSFAGVGKVVP